MQYVCGLLNSSDRRPSVKVQWAVILIFPVSVRQSKAITQGMHWENTPTPKIKLSKVC